MSTTIARRALLGASAALAAPGVLHAQGPRNLTRLVVPYTPGGSTDVTARILATRTAERLGQPWIVENRSGANGAIGASEVQRAAADGGSFLYANDVLTALPFVQRGVPFDIVEDFTPVTRVMNIAFAIVGSLRGNLPTDLAGLLEGLRRTPDRFAFASSTLGAVGHLAPAALGMQMGKEFTVVGYRGSAPAMNDVISGNVALAVVPVAVVGPMLGGGQVRAYAVTSARRVASLPDVPTLVESGFPAMVFDGWNAVWAPRNLPAGRADEIREALGATMREPAILRRLNDMGCEPSFETGEEFRRVLVAERARAAEIARGAGIRPE